MIKNIQSFLGTQMFREEKMKAYIFKAILDILFMQNWEYRKISIYWPTQLFISLHSSNIKFNGMVFFLVFGFR
jgi:hypothetical protein